MKLSKNVEKGVGKTLFFQKRILFAAFLALLILTVGCAKKEPETPEQQETPAETLSEMQITACNEADSAGTCDSRLAEVGIVLKEKCCEVLGKCC